MSLASGNQIMQSEEALSGRENNTSFYHFFRVIFVYRQLYIEMLELWQNTFLIGGDVFSRLEFRYVHTYVNR